MKATKKQLKEFSEGVKNVLTELGATPKESTLSSDPWEWTLEMETNFGKIVFHMPEPEETSVFTLFSRFVDVEKANKVLGKNFGHNIFSGKYNFNSSHGGKPAIQLVKDTYSRFWRLVDWDGNLSLGHKCYRKRFGSGKVSVGVGEFNLIVYSYGANSQNSLSSTRWRKEEDLTPEQAMVIVDRNYGKHNHLDTEVKK